MIAFYCRIVLTAGSNIWDCLKYFLMLLLLWQVTRRAGSCSPAWTRCSPPSLRPSGPCPSSPGTSWWRTRSATPPWGPWRPWTWSTGRNQTSSSARSAPTFSLRSPGSPPSGASQSSPRQAWTPPSERRGQSTDCSPAWPGTTSSSPPSSPTF